MTTGLRASARFLASLTFVVFVAACASPGGRSPHAAARSGISAWPLAELAAAPQPRVLLRAGEQPVAVVQTSALRAAWAASRRLLASIDGARPLFIVAEGDVPNAFAFYEAGEARIGANVGMVALLGDDEAAWAALLGHELAHINLRHQDVRARRRASDETTSTLLGMALMVVGIPIGTTLADAATALVERGYGRDDEREADRTGVEYMRRAGYELAGAVRFHERLAGASGERLLPFLSTHPSGGERVEAMRTLVRELGAEAK